MYTSVKDVVHYSLPLGDETPIEMNPLIGQSITMTWQNTITCKNCGNTTKTSFAQGFCYACFQTSPQNSECIIRPELCEAHLGKGIRDAEWDAKHHNQPHFVYLALTDAIKVGVTRGDQIPTRWIDQGAWKGIVLAEVPYRQLAGEIETELKAMLTDKTNWRNMLRDIRKEGVDLVEEKYNVADALEDDYQDFVSDDDAVLELKYPVTRYPEKVNSKSFDKTAVVGGVLTGIRGQYLLFEDGGVINMRKFQGYHIDFEVGNAPAKAATLFD